MQNKMLLFLIFSLLLNVPAWAQENISTDGNEIAIVETEIDVNDTQAVDKQEDELREYFLKQLNTMMLYPELYHLERYTTTNQTAGFRVELSWVRKQDAILNFDEQKFREDFQKQIAIPTEARILFLKIKTTPSGTLPGMKFGENFSANLYTSPITYNRNGATNHSYMGKQNYYNNAEWFEGSGRLQFFMDLSNFLNLRTRTKILLTAGVYSSFLDIKQQDNFNGYINNINNQSLNFHLPNYTELNFGIRIKLDGGKKKKTPVPFF